MCHCQFCFLHVYLLMLSLWIYLCMLFFKILGKLFAQTNNKNNCDKWLTCSVTQRNLENYKYIITILIYESNYENAFFSLLYFLMKGAYVIISSVRCSNYSVKFKSMYILIQLLSWAIGCVTMKCIFERIINI